MSWTEGTDKTESEKRLVRRRIQLYAPEPWAKGKVYKDTQELFDLLSRWFKKLQDGSHVRVQPNPFGSMSRDKADELVETLDACMERHGAWLLRENNKTEPYEAHPEFRRLSPNARIALWQEVQGLFRYQDEHPDEYHEMVEVEVASPTAQMHQVRLERQPHMDRDDYVYPEMDGL